MTNKQCFLRKAILLLGLIVHATAYAEVMNEINNASIDARKVINEQTTEYSNSKSIIRLEAALKKGEEVNSQLKAQLEINKAEREELLKIQTTLASGLIGSLVTTIVAIAGAILSAKNSKPDRDLKRLTVIEKINVLKQAGCPIPRDIEDTYNGASAPIRRWFFP